ncbi:B-box zinc finger protein 20-like isoform X2 [Prosopis cineraria]|nr:B-box zinc finger protein 20-like isoform X2 [Prosopis cineraria]
MKIQCDVCEKMEASVFCAADEAALCHGCDSSIHHANKLAVKHMRFSLHHPTSKDSPLCDICQEKRAYLFCKEDRAILCRECDLSIHRANEHTQKHSRFLLTGVKLADSSSGDPSSSSSNVIATEHKRVDNGCRGARRSCRNSNMNSRPRWDCNNNNNNENFSSSNSVVNSDTMISDTEAVSTSSFSEYLIETIPGYCFEDLIDSSFPPL